MIAILNSARVLFGFFSAWIGSIFVKRASGSRALARDAAMFAPLVAKPTTKPAVSSLQRATPAGQAKLDIAPFDDALAPRSVHEALRSPGQPLDLSSRASFEPRVGMDFSRVRIHTGAQAAESAQAVSATAYTVGRDIVFGAGQFRPQAPRGRQLLRHELMHVARVIPLDGTPHLSKNIRQLFGDSRGHWEGDSLVVDTTNFTDETPFRGPRESTRQDIFTSRDLHVIERFTRTGAETIQYRFTVDDPTTFSKPWSAEITMRRIDGPIFEYACHEGNYRPRLRFERRSGAGANQA